MRLRQEVDKLKDQIERINYSLRIPNPPTDNLRMRKEKEGDELKESLLISKWSLYNYKMLEYEGHSLKLKHKYNPLQYVLIGLRGIPIIIIMCYVIVFQEYIRPYVSTPISRSWYPSFEDIFHAWSTWYAWGSSCCCLGSSGSTAMGSVTSERKIYPGAECSPLDRDGLAFATIKIY